MTLPRIMAILEDQKVDVSIHPSGQCAQARILGIATTAEKIMEAVSAAIVSTDIISVRQRRDLVQFLRRPDAAPAREIQQQIDAAVDAERKRCAEIVQLARHDEIDRDFRSIIHRIEDAWDPARLEDEKAELKEGK